MTELLTFVCSRCKTAKAACLFTPGALLAQTSWRRICRKCQAEAHGHPFEGAKGRQARNFIKTNQALHDAECASYNLSRQKREAYLAEIEEAKRRRALRLAGGSR
jgi:hypothetical protein